MGSRYIPGGKTDDKWTFYRYLNSQLACLLARPLVAVSDPMSGFFALPRSLWERCKNLSPVGYKIGLEIIVKCKPRTIREVPIYFRTRKLGESKLTIKQQFLYFAHLRSLYRHKFIVEKS
jgi:dolichol-phosphate mannosyltransferase